MKITSGTLGGIPLFSPKGEKARPTLSRTRQAVFNMLAGRCAGAVVADFFAGTGAYGFEAISNGASRVIFIDTAQKALILRNAGKLKVNLNDLEVYTEDFEKSAVSMGHRGIKSDIIFMDPPYNKGFVARLLRAIRKHGLLADNGVVVCELHREEATESAGEFAEWEITKDKAYGETRVMFLELKKI